jgi:hypothetical protein
VLTFLKADAISEIKDGWPMTPANGLHRLREFSRYQGGVAWHWTTALQLSTLHRWPSCRWCCFTLKVKQELSDEDTNIPVSSSVWSHGNEASPSQPPRTSST